MNDFEKWFMDQDFYTNMRFIHGDALFVKDGFVYRVLPVQMTYVAWDSSRTKTKDEYVVVTQKWFDRGLNACQEEVNKLKTQLAVYKEDMQLDAEKIAHLTEMNQRYKGKMQEQQDQIVGLHKRIDKALFCVNQAKDGYYGFSSEGGDTDTLAKHLEIDLRGEHDHSN